MKELGRKVVFYFGSLHSLVDRDVSMRNNTRKVVQGQIIKDHI